MKDLIKYTLNNMKRRILRNSLTTLSILIGIMSIFALLSFGQGLTKYTEDIFMEMGTDKIMIQMRGLGSPGSNTEYFSQDDFDFIDKQKEIGETTGMNYATEPVTYDLKKKAEVVSVVGGPVDKTQKLFMEFSTYKIIDGRNLKKGDKYKAVLGYNYGIKNKIFDKAIKAGDKIYIDEIQFDVVGILDEIGNPEDDKTIVIPIDTAKEITKKNGYDYIIARMKSTENIPDDVKRIEREFRKKRGEEEGSETFFIQTFEELFEQFGSTIAILNSVLVLIAGISIVVASINIINTMYTSVYERTKEIGILKAIGAKNSDVVFIFTLESTVIGFFGGLLGVLVGWGVSSIGGYIVDLVGYSFLQPIFTKGLIIFCVLLATGVGCISGILPAKNASKTDPVNCLRYE